ncbi:MAG: protease complex subunit PrcB family protein [Chloroflexota bacterium]
MSPSPTSSSSRSIAFSEVAATSMARDDGGPAILVGTTDVSRATIVRVIPNVSAPSGRVLVVAFQGEQRTGGYAIQITAVERRADQLIVRATFTEPRSDSFVTQVITSPAHVVSIAAADAAGVREAILIDADGVERARVPIT